MIELRKYSHADRLNLGGKISDRVLSKYGEAVLAVFICGSTTKNLDRPYSDLEIISVVRDGVEIPAKYYVYHGLVVEVDYAEESKILKRARTVSRSWPLEADHYRNRIVLFERDNWLEKLQMAVEENDKADSREALRIAAVELTEDLETLLNARLTEDTMGVKLRGRVLAGEAAELVLLLNREYVKTTSLLWKQAFDCKEKPAEFEKYAKVSAGLVPASMDEVVSAARKLYTGIMRLVESRGISAEADELVI